MMDIYRLLKEELQYELEIRKINSEGNCQELRRRLQEALSEDVSPDYSCVANLDPNTEFKICKKKYLVLQGAVGECDEDAESSELKRLKTRLLHTYQR